MNRNDFALDTLAREELGLDPDTLGSPWVAASSSFLAFAVGAAIPVIPFLVGSGTAPTIVATVISVLALFGVGATTSIFTGRHAGRSGLRMALIGAVVALVTFGIGTPSSAGPSRPRSSTLQKRSSPRRGRSMPGLRAAGTSQSPRTFGSVSCMP